MADPASQKYSKVKAPKLTQEQRKARRVEKKKLKVLAAQQAKKDRYHQFLNRELEHTKLTESRAEQEWQNMCSAIKMKDVQDDFQETWQGLNRILQRKAHIIDRLMEQYEDFGGQFRRNMCKHSYMIDYLINLGQTFQLAIQNFYTSECHRMLTEFHLQCSKRLNISGENKMYFENILHASNTIAIHKLEETEKQFVSERDEIVINRTEMRLYLSDSILSRMDLLRKQIRDAVKLMYASPEHNDNYQKLAFKVAASDVDSKMMAEKIRNYRITIGQLKYNYTVSELSALQKLNDLKRECRYFTACYWQLKQKHQNVLQTDNSNLRFLAATTHTTIKELETLMRNGKFTLGLAARCRKLETAEEKILPMSGLAEFSTSVEHSDAGRSTNFDYTDELALFWAKISAVKSATLLLRQEKKHLEADNLKLQQLIKHYCHTYNRTPLRSSRYE